MRARTFLLHSIALLALCRCNYPVCIGGVGVHGQDDCEGGAQGGTTGSPGTPSTGTFQVTANPTTIVVGQTSQVTASGGQHGPYNYTIEQADNPSITFSQLGSVDSQGGVYHAPTTIAPQTTLTIKVRATDATNQFNTVTITVNAG